MLRSILYRLPFVMPLYHFLWAFFGALRYRFPSRKILLVGVTGTKGKTTVVELMNAILKSAGERTAMLSSLSVELAGAREKNRFDMTMPGRFFIQRFLRRAVRAHCRYAIVEVTSQGVVQYRHRFMKWDSAFILNLHPEHVEAHGSFQAYRAAKLSFLKFVARQGGHIFINKNDEHAEFFARELRGAHPAFYARDTASDGFASPGLAPTDFNKDNIAAAIALARHIGLSDHAIGEGIRAFQGVPGRMEYVAREPFSVVVDYAHTPDSLRAVYQALKPDITHAQGRLICVLGSAGGGRDKWKRPEMGRIAASYCDALVLTNEDPYDENSLRIIEDIERGVRENPRFQAGLSSMTWKIEDRREGIRTAISIAHEGDVVVVTGKGSEEWIHVRRRKKIPWSDVAVVKEILKEENKKNRPAP